MRKLLVVVGLVVACERDETEHRDPPKPPSPLDAIELPEVAGYGFEPSDGTAAVIVSRTALAVDGVQVVALRDGAFAPEDKEGGAYGIKAPKLTVAVAKLDAGVKDKPPLVLAFDRRLTYAQLIEVIYNATQKQAERKSFAILARAGKRIVRVPLELPARSRPSQSDAEAFADLLTGEAVPQDPKRRPQGDLGQQIAAVRDQGQRVTIGGGNRRRPSPQPTRPAPATADAAPLPPAPPSPLRLVVSVTDDKIELWSMSQLEGTLKEPKAALDPRSKTALTDLGRALHDIVQRRFAKTRSAEDRAIVLQARAATPLQTVVEILGALRATPDGKELFPEIQLSSGFE